MIHKKLLKFIFVTLLCAIPITKAGAQSGTIQGVITDQNGLYVPGALISIETLKKGAVSDFDGRFTLVGVPEGTFTIKTTFIGYKDLNQEVVVTAGQTISVELVLEEGSEDLNAVVVSGYLSGQAKALNKQKNNMNITNVVSTDQIGKFPDANIGDAVKRISGVTMQVDQGEARNIIVRGLSPQLNSVTVNGSRIPSAEGDNRNVQMDLIPSDMIQTIEVNKTVTPDMDADALGGSVNLLTRTAPQDFRVSATLGSGVNFITEKRILNGALLVGSRSKNKKFGWMVSASANDNDFGSDNIEAEWSDKFEYFDGTDVVEMDVNPYATVFEQRTYLVQRIRRSISANGEYAINDNNKIYLKTMYNWRDDRENRYRLEQEILDGEDIGIGDFQITDNTPTQFPVSVVRQTKGGVGNNRNKNRRLEDQRMQNYTLGGDHLFGKLKVDWMGSYAKASEERLDERYVEYESEYIINNDISDSRFPSFNPLDAAFANDLSNFEYGEITNENQYTDEEDINGFINFQLPADFFNKGEGFIKFGGRARLKTKTRNNDFFEYDFEDDFATMADIVTNDYSDPDFLAGGQYQAGPFADETWLGGLNLTNGVSVPDEFLRANFNVAEDVYAGYIMANQKLTKKLDVLVGVRMEMTNIESTGNNILDEDSDLGDITATNSYTNILPALHFKYDVSKRTVLRLAWTNTIARPNYVDLVPYTDVVTGDEEIYLGNPDLDPATSMNFDLLGEHYFKSVGILSGGIFYKRIQNFTYTYQTETTDDTYGEETTGFDIFQPLNGDDATILGAEVGFQRKLDFLPGFAKNFSLYLNYTFLTSSADGIRNEDGDERDDLGLPNTAPNMFNGSLAYSDKKFDARISVNFSDAYIDEIGGNPFEDRYYDKQFFLDFNMGYAISKNFRVYADLTNITNQPLRYYQGVSSRTQQMEYYGRRFTIGVKYDFTKKSKKK